MKVRLNHYCNMKGVRGCPGKVVEVKPEYRDNAQKIIDRGGAELVVGEVETAAVAPAENAATRTAAPRGRNGKKE